MSWTFADLPVGVARLEHTAERNWSFIGQVVSDEAPSGAVTLVLPGLTLRGVVLEAGLSSQRVTVRACGGVGTVLDGQQLAPLAAKIPGQHFQTAQGRLVAQSILSAAGEALDSASDAPGLTTILPHWAYFAGPAALALEQLCARLGCTWWMTDEGQVHLGLLAFPAAAPAGAVLQDTRQDLRRLTVALEQEAVQPRTTYEGHGVLAVDHTLTPDTWRAQVRY